MKKSYSKLFLKLLHVQYHYGTMDLTTSEYWLIIISTLYWCEVIHAVQTFFFLKTLKIKINWCGKRQTQWAQTYNNKWTCIGHHVDYIRGLGAFSASSHGIRPCFFNLRTESAIMRAVLRWYPPLVTIRIGMFRLRTWLNTSLSLSMIPWRCWLFILKVHVLLLRLF